MKIKLNVSIVILILSMLILMTGCGNSQLDSDEEISYGGNSILEEFTIVGGGSKKPNGGTMVYKNIYCPLAFSGNTTKIKINFSGINTEGKRVNYPKSFHKNGFSMGCEECDTYIAVIFDCDKKVDESNVTYEDTSQYIVNHRFKRFSYTYIIGIKDVTSEKELEKAFYEGVYAANNKVSNDIAVNKSNEAYFGSDEHGAHDVRVTYDGISCYIECSQRPDWPFIEGNVAIVDETQKVLYDLMGNQYQGK